MAVAALLREHGAEAVEASPGLFDVPLPALTPERIAAERAFWEDRELPLTAMQALLFGRPDLRLFGTAEQRRELAAYLRSVFRVASGLGVAALVFGSPKNRLRGALSEDEAFSDAVMFFREVADDAAAVGCVLCIEANAEDYGCDWITTHAQAAALVRAVDHPGFGLQLDAGVMQMNGETPEEMEHVLLSAGVLPAHVHLSRPFLQPLTMLDERFHTALCSMLRRIGYRGTVSIEMKAPDGPDPLSVLGQALDTALAVYGARS